MRVLFALCLTLAACSADPVLLPDATAPDAGPCGGACGAGTVCEGGSCVAVDAGAVDRPAVDVGEDRPAPVDLMPMDTGSDVGFDAGPMDVGGALDVTDASPWRPMLPDGSYYHPIGPCESCRVRNGDCACGDGGLVYTCREGFAECDGQYATGCEVDLTSNPAHCGACGTNCGGIMCYAGRCRP